MNYTLDTLPKELDDVILNQLDDEELLEYCHTNKKINQICNQNPQIRDRLSNLIDNLSFNSNYFSSNLPYVKYTDLEFPTASMYLANIVNLYESPRLLSTTMIEGDEDYTVVTSGFSEYNEINDDVPHEETVTVDLFSYGDLYRKYGISRRMMMQRLEYLKNDLDYRIGKIDITRDKPKYWQYYGFFKIYIELFTTALLIGLVKFHEFGRPFGTNKFDEHVFTNLNSTTTVKENLTILRRIIAIMKQLHRQIFEYVYLADTRYSTIL
jgi:hypothetical protein